MLGLGVVAAVIGFATLAVSGTGGSAAAAPSQTATASASAPAATPSPGPSADGSVPLPHFGSSPTSATTEPTIATPPPAPAPAPAPVPAAGSVGGGGGAAVARVPLRVYNNGTIHGLAAQAAQDFRNSGWTVTAEGNYPSGIISTSTVYYRPGTDEQAAAQLLGSQFGLRVEPRFAGLDDASPGLIVIVTNDYQRR
nr:LytR C-terminal domain-containing protein [Pseudonocardia acidicola]